MTKPTLTKLDLLAFIIVFGSLGYAFAVLFVGAL